MMIGSDADRVALPILPPSTSKARQYFFQKIRTSATAASNDIKHAVNRTADGKTRYYITTAVLISYAKSWKKAKQQSRITGINFKPTHKDRTNSRIFSAPHLAFPNFLAASAESVQPLHGIRTLGYHSYASITLDRTCDVTSSGHVRAYAGAH
jgi:hypothetical protein